MPTLEENVNRVKVAKTAIGAAITAKGGTVASGDGLEEFAADIATIPSGSRADAESYLMTIESSGFVDTSYAYIVNSTDKTYVYGQLGATASKTTRTVTLKYSSTFTPIATKFVTGFMNYHYDNSSKDVLSSSVADITIDTTNHTVTIAFHSNYYFKMGTNLICMVFKI